ncbi:MAG: YeiH family protein [Vicinamibacterales bacterium]
MQGDVTSYPAAASQPLRLGEDWLSVVVGGALIACVLAGARPAGPVQLAALVLVPVVIGALALGARLAAFVPGVLLVAALGWLSQVLAGLPMAASLGLEYVIFALAIGLAINHTVRVPAWLREALRTEYYIKTGLVVLGASILFDEIARAGLLGIAQAIVVVLSVWSFSFWLCKRLGVDDEFATMLSSAVSICGVSAAIATCGAIQGDRRKLSYVTSLVLIVAMPMMIVMPWIARAVGMPEMVAGAWLGGTLDTSAAVVAGGELIGEAARDVAVVVKLSQNALIGVAAFALTIWWAMKGTADGGNPAPAASLSVIWERFPKFVFGFMVASLVFSFLLDRGTVGDTRPVITAVRTMLFAMAFVSIGLETSLTSLVRTDDGRPALAFLGGQAFNVVVTLVAAYAFFGGTFFALP